MKLSQLIYIMDKDDDIIVNTRKNVSIDKKCLYHGTVRGIHKDDPMNKAHVSFLMALDNAILVEISPKEATDEQAD